MGNPTTDRCGFCGGRVWGWQERHPRHGIVIEERCLLCGREPESKPKLRKGRK